jgi:hypothetical protein
MCLVPIVVRGILNISLSDIVWLVVHHLSWVASYCYVTYFIYNNGTSVISGPGSSVGITTVYGRSGDRIPVGVRFFPRIQTGPGAHPAFCTMGTGSFPGVKRPGRGADQPPPPSAEVENE